MAKITSNILVDVSGGKDVYNALAKAVSAAGLGKSVQVAAVDGFGVKAEGAVVKVLPSGGYYTGVAPEDADRIVQAAASGEGGSPVPAYTTNVRVALKNVGYIDPASIDDYIATRGYEALGGCLTNNTPQDVIAAVKASGLRGRGGAGFPTGLKWEFAGKSAGDKKYVICNADEGDPGAFMDRSVLEGDPHAVLEAMAICGYAIGADEGVIYCRAEYPLAVARLENAINQAEALGLLGDNILGTGFSFKISINLGAGAFVCGEETALINSIEGQRGEPRLKPPFPAAAGLWMKPSNVNNVETYACVRHIFLNGPEWFAGIGTEKSKGTKVFALAGKINNVGLIEVPMGTTLREIIYDIGGGIRGGKQFKAIQTGGPSGGCIPASLLDLPIDYESLASVGSMMGSGGLIVMDEDDCMVNIARYYLDFTVEESCGKCTPCRIGNMRLLEMLEEITSGKGKPEYINELRELGEVIKDASLCGLGQTAPNPVLSTMHYFMDEYEAHIRDHKCPAGACSALLKYVIDPEKCTGCTLCARNCPVDCIAGERRKTHVIDQERCIKCGTCMAKCRFGAISRV
ncbi:MAG: NADH-quinone oxidoreductase subunit NuoF [Clostridiales bacterium]|jgi:NADH:ubiquinone oxidoreductase subunit F (NADH-binding)/NAD-dependent dihydropyrimidine dehydrogenase PreA subunit|nr:NADH-quinone oxidoreductase subunit NuoF [Clostridiales bacterium]